MLFSSNQAKVPNLNSQNPIKSLSKYKVYYNENFGFKASLVSNYIDFKSIVLNESPMPNKVVEGKDGWFFLGNHFNNAFNNAYGNDVFLDGQLDKITQNILETKNYLTSKGIQFYMVIPPNKSRIYGEHLPFKLTQRKTKVETLKSHLKQEIGIDILDLRDILITNKKNQQLFIKTDTHWNDYGAFIGYSETVKMISKDLKINTVSLSDYHLKTETKLDGDITNMLYLNKGTENILLSKKIKSAVEPKISTYDYQHFINPNNSYKLLMHRDSFANAWIQFFNESFNEVIYLRHYELNKSIIEKEKPDLVIFEIVERNIDFLGQ